MVVLAITGTIIVAANAHAGRWLSRDPIQEGAGFVQRDPIAEPGFAVLQKAQASRQIGISSHWLPKNFSNGDFNSYGFVKNDPISQFDYLGLCPAETCDKWTMTVVLIRAIGIEGPAALDVRTKLTADGNCCMKEHVEYYRYLGYGLGVGAESTFNFKVGSHTFNTPCISWSAHKGIGRVTGIGGGIIWTYGLTYFTTPQAYFSIASGSKGFDAGIFTTAGYWWFEKNGPD